MNKLLAFWNLFKVGSSVANPELWKRRQITVTVLGAVILAVVNLAASFGYALPIDTETANAIAGGILAIINVILTITTTDKVGVSSNGSNPTLNAKEPLVEASSKVSERYKQQDEPTLPLP